MAQPHAAHYKWQRHLPGCSSTPAAAVSGAIGTGAVVDVQCYAGDADVQRLAVTSPCQPSAPAAADAATGVVVRVGCRCAVMFASVFLAVSLMVRCSG